MQMIRLRPKVETDSQEYWVSCPKTPSMLQKKFLNMDLNSRLLSHALCMQAPRLEKSEASWAFSSHLCSHQNVFEVQILYSLTYLREYLSNHLSLFSHKNITLSKTSPQRTELHTQDTAGQEQTQYCEGCIRSKNSSQVITYNQFINGVEQPMTDIGETK